MADSDEKRKDSSNPAEGSKPAPPSADAFADLFSMQAGDAESPDAPAPEDTPAQEPADDPAATEAAGIEESGQTPVAETDSPEDELDGEEAFDEGFSEDELASQAVLAEDSLGALPTARVEEESEEEAAEDGEPTAEEAIMLAAFAQQDTEKAEEEEATAEVEQAAVAPAGLEPESDGASETVSGVDAAEAQAPPPAQPVTVMAPSGGGEPRTGLVYVLAAMNLLLVVLVGALVVGVLLWGGGRSAPRQAGATIQPEPRPRDPDRSLDPGEIVPPTVLSWQQAEQAYLNGQAAQAIKLYKGLFQACRAQSSDSLAADFCMLRIARCRILAGQATAGRELLERVAHSRSPILRALANQDLGMLDGWQGAHLRGRMKAYLSLAALSAVEGQAALRSDGEFLVARCLTDKVLSFATIDASVPWKLPPRPADPFVGLDATASRRLLEEGADTGGSLLGPRIEPAPARPIASAWKVACYRVPLEEFLHQFAGRTAMEVEWVSVSPAERRRAVTMNFRSASAQSIFEIACGSAGLIARFTGEKVLIHNPHTIGSMSRQRALIRDEAISTWRRFYLRFPSDSRGAQGHYASALLSECAGDDLAALREHQLIAQRYPRDKEMAPWALLRGARIRIRLRDHLGARADLDDVLDLYPDFPAIDQAHLDVGLATMQAGRLTEAADMFKKLYYLDLSTSSQAQACLYVGRCDVRLGRYKEAMKWLGRYVALSPREVGPDMVDAYMLTGHCLSELGNLPEAAAALRHVLSLKPTRSQRIEALLALAETESKRSRFGRVIAAFNKTAKEPLSPREYAQATLARARAFRAMGLPERGLGLLRQSVGVIKDAQAKAEITIETARCHADTGDLPRARKALADLLPQLKPGPMARAASIELARVCLAEGKAAQTVVICRNLLTPAAADDVRRTVLGILADAYRQQQDHGRLAMTLAGMTGRDGAVEKP